MYRQLLIERFIKPDRWCQVDQCHQWCDENGLPHSYNDRPAILNPDGTFEWCKHGKPHRDGDKPAIIYSGGAVEWCKNGKTHRGNGKPAYINYSNNREEYWINGEELEITLGDKQLQPGDLLALGIFSVD